MNSLLQSPLLQPLMAVYAGLVGLVLGSYLNVLIHRLPRGKSTVLPRSRCTYCGAPIRARDNVPVLSFLLLGGRCRQCRAPISVRYPLIELLTAGLFVLCVLRFRVTFDTFAALVFVSLMVLLAFIDLEHMLLPDKITLPGIVVGLALQPWVRHTTWLDALIGVLAGAGILILLINFWYWLRGEEGMGMGDVNMLAMIGAFLGWQGVLASLLLAALAGALTGLALMAGGRLKMSSKLPFGVFLALGAVLALFWGESLVELYSRWL